MTVESTGFKASDVLAGSTEGPHRQPLVGKQLHWNITGENSLAAPLPRRGRGHRHGLRRIASACALQVVPQRPAKVVAQRNTCRPSRDDHQDH